MITEETLISDIQPPIEGFFWETRHRVIVIIKDAEEDNFLVVKESFDGQERTVFPGGGIEEGESIEAAAKREIEEETGYYSFLSCTLLDYVLKFSRRHEDHNRLNINHLVICEVSKNHKKGGEFESLWIKKEYVASVLETNFGEAVWKYYLTQQN